MGRKKNWLRRSDEWALNSIVACAIAKDFPEFLQIRAQRREVNATISEDYYGCLVRIVQGIMGPRSFTRAEFDDWFACTCLPAGTKGQHLHVRIPRMDHKQRKEFADVLWMWVSLIRSKDVGIRWK